MFFIPREAEARKNWFVHNWECASRFGILEKSRSKFLTLLVEYIVHKHNNDMNTSQSNSAGHKMQHNAFTGSRFLKWCHI